MIKYLRLSNLFKHKNFYDFTYKRTFKEALGFYLTYFVFAYSIGLIISLFLKYIIKSPTGISTGILVLIYSLIIAYLTKNFVEKKGLFKSKKYLLLAIISVIISLFSSYFFALIIPTYFSTLDKKSETT